MPPFGLRGDYARVWRVAGEPTCLLFCADLYNDFELSDYGRWWRSCLL